MIPLIAVSNNQEKQDIFIQQFAAENSISQYYIYKIYPPKTEITIDQVRSIKNEIITKTSHLRLFVLYSFDSASLESQNALLKTLEEKNEQNQFIMFVKNSERVIPTIRSRAKLIHLGNKEYNEQTVMFELFKKIELSTNYSFFSYPEFLNITKETAENLIDEFTIYLRNKIKTGDLHSISVAKKALQTKSLLLNNNLNPQMAVDSVLIYFKKTVSQT